MACGQLRALFTSHAHNCFALYGAFLDGSSVREGCGNCCTAALQAIIPFANPWFSCYCLLASGAEKSVSVKLFSDREGGENPTDVLVELVIPSPPARRGHKSRHSQYKNRRNRDETLVAYIGVLALAGLAWAQQRGGSITIAIQTEPAAWDPTQVAGADISRVVYDNVLQGLVKRNPKGEIVPSLATRWTVSNSGLTYTFTLRQGVKFHDGSDFTAQDVLAKFNRARNPDTRASGHLRPDLYRDIANITSPNPNTVVFSLRQPNNDFLFILSRPESLIGPRQRPLAEQRVQPIGTGPFRFAAWERGVAVRLERNPNYYLQGLPYLDRVNFRFLGDGDAQLAGLRAGDLDVIAYSPAA
jgi:hypothetical protein